ncbi:MAG: ATP-binding protein [Anaerolineae bacterium]|nr:ATP-binding protein [Anaerolineae bacterium]
MLISSDSHAHTGGTQEAERFVQSALDALSAHIAILDKTGRIIGVNASWQQFADGNGFSAGNYGIGLNYLKVCDNATVRHSPDAPIIARGIRDIISGHLTEFEMEYPCHSPLQRRWFVARISRFEWYNEMRLIVAHQNVTELRQVQVELGESKRRIELILQNINNGIITIDSSGTIETANPATARIFGYALDDIHGMHLGQLITEPFTGSSTLKKLNGDLGHELTGIRRDGSTFPIYFALNELRLDDGSLYTCIVQDITIRKQMEAERLEREKLQVALDKERELRELKNRFLSMMSHELRTPLASISLSYDMLKKYGAVSTPEEKDQALENIHTQVDYLADMVTDVLTLSRSESEGLAALLEDADLITYCRDIVEEFQFQYHRTHTIEFECSERTLRTPLDRKLLRRAFTNLLSNAVKYTPQGGSVIFRLTRVGEDAVIEVSDSGIGIPLEDQPRLFEPFHRARNASNIPGTGLGLPITRQAVELHRGSIHYTTGSSGTTFRIRLPLHQD